MAYEQSINITDIEDNTLDEIVIRNIGRAELKSALVRGFSDFLAMPTHLVFLCLIYPVVTLIAARIYGGYEVLPLVFPALAGYTLIGPLVATGMYELSRRRELGMDISRQHVYGFLRSPPIWSIILLSLLLTAIYFLWLGAAWAIFTDMTGGMTPESVGAFVTLLFSTVVGQQLILVGCTTGFIVSIAVLTISSVSVPMLMDKKVKLMVAIDTSIRVVLTNPLTIGVWGIIVTGALLIGSLPFFVGLAVVLPVLGHATWHLYRATVEYN